MKKSKKITIFYAISSLALFLILAGGGAYGLYLSVGVNYINSTGFSSVLPRTYARNQNITNTITGSGVGGLGIGTIILSCVLILLALLDVFALIKQIIYFKKINSSNGLGRNKIKATPIIFAFVIDVLSLVVSVWGIVLGFQGYAGNGFSWIFYLINGLIGLFAVISMVLLVMKLKQKSTKAENQFCELLGDKEFSIDRLEYELIKLKHLKSSKIISADECEMLRSAIIEKYHLEELDKKIK